MKLLLFENIHKLLMAENVLKQHQVQYELLPVPHELWSECGMCLGIQEELIDTALTWIGEKGLSVQIEEKP